MSEELPKVAYLNELRQWFTFEDPENSFSRTPYVPQEELVEVQKNYTECNDLYTDCKDKLCDAVNESEVLKGEVSKLRKALNFYEGPVEP